MDKIGPVNIFTLACLVASICCFALAPFANNLGLLFLFAILYGSSGGAFMTYIPVCTASLFGVQTAASKLGVIYVSMISSASGILVTHMLCCRISCRLLSAPCSEPSLEANSSLQIPISRRMVGRRSLNTLRFGISAGECGPPDVSCSIGFDILVSGGK
jgi:MFS family permease